MSEVSQRDGRFAPSAILGLAAVGLAAGPWLSCAVGMQQYPAARRILGFMGFVATLVGTFLFSTGQLSAAPLMISGASVVILWFDSRPQNLHPLRWSALPLGSIVAISIFVEIAQAFPNVSAQLWRIIGTRETISETQFCLALATVSFGIGMTGLVPGVEPIVNLVVGFFERTRDRAGLQAGRGVLVVGVGVFLIVTSIQGTSYLSATSVSLDYASILGAFSILYYVAMYAAAFRVLRERKLDWRVVAWLTLTLAMLIASGSKGRFFTWWVQPLFLIYLLERRRLGPQPALVVIAVFVFSTAVVYPTLVEYRAERVRDDSGDVVASLQQAGERRDENLIDKLVYPIAEGYVAEQAVAVSSIVHFHPSRPSERLLLRLVGFWIPRFVWSSKPEALNTNELGRETMRVGEQDTGTSVLSTAPGELYAYFGTFGMLMLILSGLVCRTIERSVATDTRTALGAGFAAILNRELSVLIGGGFEAELVGWVQRGLALALVLLFVTWVSKAAPVKVRA